MSSRRTLILVGAIALGAFAAFALLNYVRGIEDDVYKDAQPVEVLMAARDIPEGTPASEALAAMEVKEIPLEIRPATFIPPEATDQIAGLVALNDIPANQIIVDGLFVDPTVVQLSFRDQVPTGNVAISVSIDQVRAVGGYLQPGDEVNLMVVHDGQGCQQDAAAVGSEDTGAPPVIDDGITDPSEYCTYTQPARYVFQRVEILAIGDRLQLQPGEQAPEATLSPQGGTITFMVPNEAAQLIASIAPEDIYLTLLPEDYRAEPLPALTADDLEGPTPAEDPTRLTPYGPDGYIEGDGVVSPSGNGG